MIDPEEVERLYVAEVRRLRREADELRYARDVAENRANEAERERDEARARLAKAEAELRCMRLRAESAEGLYRMAETQPLPR